ncbi:hypothetical protein Tco_0389104 [Tanacetum coccineum]
MDYSIRQVKSSLVIKMNPDSVDKNDPKDVQLQDEDIMYDIDLYFVKALYVDELENLLDDFMLSLNTEIDEGSIEEKELEGKWPINVDHPFIAIIPISQLTLSMLSPIPSPVPQTTSLMNATSSKNLLEAAEDTIEELRDESKLWERRAQKLMLDLEILKEKFSDQSKSLVDSQMEISGAQA